MAITSYDDLTTTFAKILCGAYRAGSVPVSTLDAAKTASKITTDEYNFIKG